MKIHNAMQIKFFILCDVIFLVRLQEKFEFDHSWEWKVETFYDTIPVINKSPHPMHCSLQRHSTSSCNVTIGIATGTTLKSANLTLGSVTSR